MRELNNIYKIYLFRGWYCILMHEMAKKKDIFWIYTRLLEQSSCANDWSDVCTERPQWLSVLTVMTVLYKMQTNPWAWNYHGHPRMSCNSWNSFSLPNLKAFAQWMHAWQSFSPTEWESQGEQWKRTSFSASTSSLMCSYDLMVFKCWSSKCVWDQSSSSALVGELCHCQRSVPCAYHQRLSMTNFTMQINCIKRAYLKLPFV